MYNLVASFSWGCSQTNASRLSFPLQVCTVETWRFNTVDTVHIKDIEILIFCLLYTNETYLKISHSLSVNRCHKILHNESLSKSFILNSLFIFYLKEMNEIMDRLWWRDDWLEHLQNSSSCEVLLVCLCSVVLIKKPWVLPFMWMFLDMYYPPKHCTMYILSWKQYCLMTGTSLAG